MRRRIRRAKIKHISLVPRGANALQTIYKADPLHEGRGSVSIDALAKFDQEKGELLAVVYAPEQRDMQGDIASAEVIKEMAYEYARTGEGIDIRHDGKTLAREAAFVAEHFIIQKNDPRFTDAKDYNGNPVDVTGGWGVVMKIDDPALRAKYGKEGWNGVSMGGEGEVEVENDGFISKFTHALGKLLGLNTSPGDDDMTPEQVTQLGKSICEGVVAGLTPLLKQAPPAPDKPAASTITLTPNAGESLADFTGRVAKEQPEAKGADVLAVFQKAQAQPNRPAKPIFKGDTGNAEDVQKHEIAMQRWLLAKDVDFDNPTSLAEYRTKLAEFQKSISGDAGADGADDPADDFQTDRERALAKENDRLRKASNQPPAGGKRHDDLNASSGVRSVNFSKEEDDLFRQGAEMAAAMNKANGYGE